MAQGRGLAARAEALTVSLSDADMDLLFPEPPSSRPSAKVGSDEPSTTLARLAALHAAMNEVLRECGR